MNAYTDYRGRGVNLPSAEVMTYCAPQHVGGGGCPNLIRSLIMDLVQPANLSKPGSGEPKWYNFTKP